MLDVAAQHGRALTGSGLVLDPEFSQPSRLRVRALALREFGDLVVSQ
jgi:hypothetical protein